MAVGVAGAATVAKAVAAAAVVNLGADAAHAEKSSAVAVGVAGAAPSAKAAAHAEGAAAAATARAKMAAHATRSAASFRAAEAAQLVSAAVGIGAATAVRAVTSAAELGVHVCCRSGMLSKSAEQTSSPQITRKPATERARRPNEIASDRFSVTRTARKNFGASQQFPKCSPRH